jgi:hypothetical protein
MAKFLFNILPEEWARVGVLSARLPDNETKISWKYDLGKTNNLTHTYIREEPESLHTHFIEEQHQTIFLDLFPV